MAAGGVAIDSCANASVWSLVQRLPYLARVVLGCSVASDLRAADHGHQVATKWPRGSVSRMLSECGPKPGNNWSVVGNLQLQPKTGSDLTKVLFAEFRWVPGGGR